MNGPDSIRKQAHQPTRMKRYLYNYQTILRFETPVSRHFFHLRCMPCENACQRVETADFFLQPTDFLSHGTDVWGNRIQYGGRMDAHDAFVFVSSGVVCLEPYAVQTDAMDREVFLAQSQFTPVSAPMRAFVAQADPGPEAATLSRGMALMDAIYSHMTYVPGSTGHDTTALQAFDQRAGVCQDYAHLLIALCRCAGIPARYVNGFLLGEGATHAWVEVLDGDRWRGLDPTHNQLIEYGFIKLSHGRDVADCPVSRGVFPELTNQQNEIRVIVAEI